MNILFWLLLAIACKLTLAFFSASIKVWTAAFAILLLLFSKFNYCCHPVLVVLCWILFLVIAIPINFPLLRRKLVSSKLYAIISKIMPSISETEQEALESGTVWWDGELFGGRPSWNKLLSIPAPALSEEEKEYIEGPVQKLCEMLDDWEITKELDNLPDNVWEFLKNKGFFGMIIPKKYGGLEFSALGHSSVVLKVASRSISAAVTVMVPNSLGPAKLLLDYGTEEQKNYYLPRLADGKEIPCFALTGPEAGSDASALPDYGVVCYGEFEGKKDVLGIRLNWEKRYITLGPIATVLGLAFKLNDPQHILSEKEELGITLALIPTNTKGIEIGSRHLPLNSSFLVGPNYGKDVFIPMDMVIGGKTNIGKGWRMLMDCLSEGRSISLPALSAGGSKMTSRTIGAYSRIRRQFRMSIGKFEGVEESLASIAGNTYLIDAARTMTAGAIDLGEKPSVVSAIVKYHLTERMRKIINNAMDVQGGGAICMGPRNFLARLYQSIPISITVEGANILTRTMIIFGQGAIRCHPFLLKEMKSFSNADRSEGVKEFDSALIGHTLFGITNFVRTFLLGLTNSRLLKEPVRGPTGKYFNELSRMSAAFALTADISVMLLGGSLKRKERISARLSDILSNLYLASAVLKKYHDDKEPEEDLPLVKWGVETSLYNIQESFDQLLQKNFPNRMVGSILRFFIFPVGKPYTPPSDRIEHQVAHLLQCPSSTRDRLTSGMFIPDELGEAIGRLEHALEKIIAAEPAEKKISSALRTGALTKLADEKGIIEDAVKNNIIDETEAGLIRSAIDARNDVIKVDDFPIT